MVMNEINRLLFHAEKGASSYQCFLASAINADDNYPDRLVQACKWAIISHFLGDSMAEPIVVFLQQGMTKFEFDKSFKLAEEWIVQKIDFANDPVNEYETSTWSQALRKAAGCQHAQT